MKTLKVNPELLEGLIRAFEKHYQEAREKLEKEGHQLDDVGLRRIEMEVGPDRKQLVIEADQGTEDVRIEKGNAQTFGGLVFNDIGELFGMTTGGTKIDQQEAFEHGLKSFIKDIAPYMTEEQVKEKARQLEKIIDSRPY